MSRLGADLERLVEVVEESGVDEEGYVRVLEGEEPPADERFCHIAMSSGITYCGCRVNDMRCRATIYDGEAVCPSCGKPTCPDCAVRSDLNARLEGIE